MKRYRVWMHTKPGPGCTYYSGYVDVWSEDEDDAGWKAKQKAFSSALHTGLIVDRCEVLEEAD